MNTFVFACPLCSSRLEPEGADRLRCSQDESRYARQAGIWRLLPPQRQANYTQFVHEYETVRQAEGRGSSDPAYYRRLPATDRHDPWHNDWQIRARSFQTLVKRLLPGAEARQQRPLSILDLGAGSGWLSYRLAQRGHQVAAVDLLINPWDGLGAHVHFDRAFVPVQAEFDHLPFAAAQADLVIFNASFHYATDYTVTLREALRVLQPHGAVVIMDSPLYRDGRSGQLMVQEREEAYRRRFGFPSNALPSRHYLTAPDLTQLAAALGLTWLQIRPAYGWRWRLRPYLARLRRRRQPAQFRLLIGQRVP